MSEAAKYRAGVLDGIVGRRSLNKHVTTACQACRRKRCKCDGHTPCSACSSNGDPCIYNHNDGRRQRHKHNVMNKLPDHDSMLQTHVEAVDDDRESGQTTFSISVEDSTNKNQACIDDNEVSSETVSGRSMDSSSQNGPSDGGVSSKISDKSILPNPAFRKIKPSYKVADIQASFHQTESVALASKSSDRSYKHPEAELCTMDGMQGQFETRAEDFSHNTVAVPHRSIRRRIFPKVPSISCTTCGSGALKHKQAQDQQGLYQSVQRLERRGYAVPGYARTFGNLSFSGSISANGYPVNVQARQIRNFYAPEHLVFPLADLDESPLGRAYTDFQQMGQRLIAGGMPPSQISDQGPIDVTLFFRDRIPGDPVNASTWASEMLRAFRGTFSDQLLLACAVCVAKLMRWFLMPTAETYANLPSIARPTKLQKIKPHPSWVDLMVFPTFRDTLINNLREWVEPCMKANWDILWPHSLKEALNHHPVTQQIFLTQEFATYAINPKNWLFQRSILDEFAEIEGSEMNISQT